MITAVVDGDLPGGMPKGLELFAVCDVARLDEYGVGSANNAGGRCGMLRGLVFIFVVLDLLFLMWGKLCSWLFSDGAEFMFPRLYINRGDFLHVAYESGSYTGSFQVIVWPK